MIDKQVANNYIKTKYVEQAFRAVDRGHYYRSAVRSSAYSGNVWKEGNLHLSACNIYAMVIEALELEPGMSFLNLGSGTGYLSTVAGFVLGTVYKKKKKKKYKGLSTHTFLGGYTHLVLELRLTCSV